MIAAETCALIRPDPLKTCFATAVIFFGSTMSDRFLLSLNTAGKVALS